MRPSLGRLASLAVPLCILALAGCPDSPSSDEGAGTTSDTGTTETDTETSESSGDTDTDTEIGTEAETDTGEPLPCSMLDQDCPDGDKCVPVAREGGSFDATLCVPVTGDGAIGESCQYEGALTSYDDCGGDSHCWGWNEDGVGTCTPFCMLDGDDYICVDGWECAVSSSLAVCVQPCDPLAPACADGQGCYWGGSQFSCIPTIDEPIPTGDPCGFINDCAPGNMCINADALSGCDGASCCAQFCDVNDGDGPCQLIDPGYVCFPFWEPGSEPEGQAHYGVCLAG